MFIVKIQDVQIAEIPDPKNSNQKILTLDYLSRQYVLVQVFPASGLNTAQTLWRHLTDDRSQVCLIIGSPSLLVISFAYLNDWSNAKII